MKGNEAPIRTQLKMENRGSSRDDGSHRTERSRHHRSDRGHELPMKRSGDYHDSGTKAARSEENSRRSSSDHDRYNQRAHGPNAQYNNGNRASRSDDSSSGWSEDPKKEFQGDFQHFNSHAQQEWQFPSNSNSLGNQANYPQPQGMPASRQPWEQRPHFDHQQPGPFPPPPHTQFGPPQMYPHPMGYIPPPQPQPPGSQHPSHFPAPFPQHFPPQFPPHFPPHQYPGQFVPPFPVPPQQTVMMPGHPPLFMPPPPIPPGAADYRIAPSFADSKSVKIDDGWLDDKLDLESSRDKESSSATNLRKDSGSEGVVGLIVSRRVLGEKLYIRFHDLYHPGEPLPEYVDVGVKDKMVERTDQIVSSASSFPVKLESTPIDQFSFMNDVDALLNSVLDVRRESEFTAETSGNSLLGGLPGETLEFSLDDMLMSVQQELSSQPNKDDRENSPVLAMDEGSDDEMKDISKTSENETDDENAEEDLDLYGDIEMNAIDETSENEEDLEQKNGNVDGSDVALKGQSDTPNGGSLENECLSESAAKELALRAILEENARYSSVKLPTEKRRKHEISGGRKFAYLSEIWRGQGVLTAVSDVISSLR